VPSCPVPLLSRTAIQSTRMRRKLFTLVSVVSVMLFVVTIILWIESHRAIRSLRFSCAQFEALGDEDHVPFLNLERPSRLGRQRDPERVPDLSDLELDHGHLL
jgi:hypothetical protein